MPTPATVARKLTPHRRIALLLIALTAAGCGHEPREEPARAGDPEAPQSAGMKLAAVESQGRAVAITFDDLPGVPSAPLATAREMNRKIVAEMREHRIPGVGFVVGSGIDHDGERAARLAILREWLDAGQELGSHTYSHMPVGQRPLDEVQADVVRNEDVLREVLGERWSGVRYFRHPTLATGRTPEQREAYQRFLAGRGYTIAPVTLDNQEWVYAAAYQRAAERGDRAAMRCVGQAYVPYIERTFEFFEGYSRELFERDIAHVLLLHVNRLNADYFPALVEMMQRRGYRFVSLGEALADPAYASPDGWARRGGPSWLHRWAVGRRQEMRPEPRESELIARLADRSQAAGVQVPADCTDLPVPMGSPAPQASAPQPGPRRPA